MKTKYGSIIEESRSLFGTVKTIRDTIHRHPELSFREYDTCRYICSILEQQGIRYSVVAETGVIAVIENEDPAHENCVALRADIDALPITEDESIPNRSDNGVMHACGHDIHTASLLGALLLLHRRKTTFKGTVVGIFQPGEELLPGGASLIMASGILQQYRPKAIFGQHAEYSMNIGEFGVCKGLYMASADEIYITVKGTGGHAALPHKIKNPILTASKTVTALLEINRREMPVPTVLSIGKFIANGATNVVPNEVQLEGTLRTMDETLRKELKAEIRRTAAAIALADGTETIVDIRDGYSMLKNDESTATKAIEVLQQIAEKGTVHELGTRLSSEDFGLYSLHFPALFYRLGAKEPQCDTPAAPHTPLFNPSEKSLLYGTASMAALALSFLAE